MNYIWAGMIVFAFISAIFNGNMDALSSSVLSGGGDAVTLCLKLLGTLCLWGGIMNIAEKSGITVYVCRFYPPFRVIFPKLNKDSPAARHLHECDRESPRFGQRRDPSGLRRKERCRR